VSVPRTAQADSSRIAHVSKEELGAKFQLVRAACALEELYELIETYKPMKGTVDHHASKKSARRLAKNLHLGEIIGRK
jgi:hypothetical protein